MEPSSVLLDLALRGDQRGACSLVSDLRTDQTVPVAKGTKLDINNFAGDVSIKVWDKDAVRVEVNHSDRGAVRE